MKAISIAVLLGFVAFAGVAPDAQAACACVCIEGEKRSVCNDMSEAGSDQNLCVDGPGQRDCPAPEGEIDSTIEISTPEGTVDCRRARVWDPTIDAHGAYRIINVCGLAG